MRYSYSAFGLELLADTPLPGLFDSSGDHPVDVRVWMGRIPDISSGKLLYRSPYRDESGESVLAVSRLDSGGFHFQYRDNTQFVVNRSASEIWAAWPADLNLEDTAVYLLGPIFGFVLRLRGFVCLHASGIVIGDSAIALLGAPGAGKSTTAAAFARLGYPIVTDDVFTLIDGGHSFRVQPGYPGLRLWPDSVGSLWGSPDALPAITPTWDKRYLNLMENGYEFETGPMPVAAIYILGERSSGANAPGIQNNPQPALMTLVGNSYGNYLLDTRMRAREFDVLSRVAASVPIQTAIPHCDPARLTELCQRIVEDVQALTASPAA